MGRVWQWLRWGYIQEALYPDSTSIESMLFVSSSGMAAGALQSETLFVVVKVELVPRRRKSVNRRYVFPEPERRGFPGVAPPP